MNSRIKDFWRSASWRSVIAILISGFVTAVLYTTIPTSMCGSCPRRSLTIEGPGGSYGIVDWEEFLPEYITRTTPTGPNTSVVSEFRTGTTTRQTTTIYVADHSFEIALPTVWLIVAGVVFLLCLSRFGGSVSRYIHFLYLALVGLILTILLVVFLVRTGSQIVWFAKEIRFPLQYCLFIASVTLAGTLICSQVWSEAIGAIRGKPMKYFGPNNPVR